MNYEEKLNLAKEALKSGSYDKETIEYIFPELKESEDERIRKEIIKAIHNYAFRLEEKIPSEWLDWLEKQKPVELSKSAYTNNKNVIEYADKYSHQIWEKLMDNYKRITNYSIGCNDVSDIVLNSIIDTYNWLEKQGNIDKASYEIAEKEKYDFVNGQFIQCRKSFDEFKEYNSYWFEYVGNDTYVGRSDNILNKKFHITPRQLYRLFTQQHDYYSKENNEFEKQNHVENNYPAYNPDEYESFEDGNATGLRKKQKPVKLSEEELHNIRNGVLSSCATSFINYLDKHLYVYEGKMCVSNVECEDIENAFKNTDWGKIGRYYNKFTQKPVEWSKCDEDILFNIQQDYQDKLNSNSCKSIEQYYINVINWIEELKGRALSQSKKGWSEEDEKMLNSCIAAIYAADYYDIDDKSEMEKFLKSLKPKSHWKPTDEQMYFLNWIQLNFGDGLVAEKARNVIESLYNDLKKLKEE